MSKRAGQAPKSVFPGGASDGSCDGALTAERDDAGFDAWRRELRESITAGAALAALALTAGCGANADNTSIGESTAGAQSSAGAGGAGGATTSTTSTVPVSSLEPYPLDRVTCIDTPNDLGLPYVGPQCCFEVRCYASPDGASCALAPSGNGALGYRVAPPASDEPLSGPGPCGCATEGHPALEGPYAPNPAAAGDAGSDPAAACCYVVGSRYCLGRPFVLNGLGRVAAAAHRDDWGLFG